MDEKLIQVSCIMSYALRHKPDEFGIYLDDEGWVLIDDLIDAIKSKYANLQWVTKATLDDIKAGSDKQRFDITEGSIRAFYGHSLPDQRIVKPPTKPPEKLYHGTTVEAVKKIREKGLKSMQRQYVHLSIDIETATIVGKRRANDPIVLEIAAGLAYKDGVQFYHGNEKIWLSEDIPALYIS